MPIQKPCSVGDPGCLAPGPPRRGSPKVRTKCSICGEFVCTACSRASAQPDAKGRTRSKTSKLRHCLWCLQDGYSRISATAARTARVAGILALMVLTLAGCCWGPAEAMLR